MSKNINTIGIRLQEELKLILPAHIRVEYKEGMPYVPVMSFGSNKIKRIKPSLVIQVDGLSFGNVELAPLLVTSKLTIAHVLAYIIGKVDAGARMKGAFDTSSEVTNSLLRAAGLVKDSLDNGKTRNAGPR